MNINAENERMEIVNSKGESLFRLGPEATGDPGNFKATGVATVLKTLDIEGCNWSEANASGAFDTDCGHTFLLDDGTPAENKMAFCCYCGGKLIASAA